MRKKFPKGIVLLATIGAMLVAAPAVMAWGGGGRLGRRRLRRLRPESSESRRLVHQSGHRLGHRESGRRSELELFLAAAGLSSPFPWPLAEHTHADAAAKVQIGGILWSHCCHHRRSANPG